MKTQIQTINSAGNISPVERTTQRRAYFMKKADDARIRLDRLDAAIAAREYQVKNHPNGRDVVAIRRELVKLRSSRADIQIEISRALYNAGR